MLLAHKYYLVYNNLTNIDMGIFIDSRPSKPSPIMEYEVVKVPGGKTLYRERGYDDIEITVDFNFISRKPALWDKDWRKVKKWLLSKDNNKLKFGDDLEGYYKVNSIQIDTPERILRQHGKFSVTFTCEPYFYLDCDEMEIVNGQTIHNDHQVSRPIYRITGNGELTLTINGKEIKVNVGQETIIDTEKGLTYRQGVINNTTLTGNYEDLYLQEGENTFVLTPTTPNAVFHVFITPNWRCV